MGSDGAVCTRCAWSWARLQHSALGHSAATMAYSAAREKRGRLSTWIRQSALASRGAASSFCTALQHLLCPAVLCQCGKHSRPSAVMSAGAAVPGVLAEAWLGQMRDHEPPAAVGTLHMPCQCALQPQAWPPCADPQTPASLPGQLQLHQPERAGQRAQCPYQVIWALPIAEGSRVS